MRIRRNWYKGGVLAKKAHRKELRKSVKYGLGSDLFNLILRKNKSLAVRLKQAHRKQNIQQKIYMRKIRKNNPKRYKAYMRLQYLKRKWER